MKTGKTPRNESGFALITALLILVLLTIIGLAAINSSKTELNIAANDKQHKVAFYAAEAGVETGRAVLNTLREADVGYWDLLLAQGTFTYNGDQLSTNPLPDDYPVATNNPNFVSLDPVVDILGSRTVGQNQDAEFTLLVRDNEDLDNNPLVDTDGTLVLISAATYGDAVASIETIIRYIGNDQYAQEYYNTENTNRATGAVSGVSGQKRM